MALATDPVAAAEGAVRVLHKIHHLLPRDAVWSLEAVDGDMYCMTVYADILDQWRLREAVQEFLADLLKKDVALVLVFETASALQEISDSVELRDISWSLNR
jgi:hypothetical protein